VRRPDLALALERAPAAYRPARPTRRQAIRVGAVAVASLGIATVLAAILESEAVGIADASPVYLIAVVAVGAIAGTFSAVATAFIAFIVYDLLFTQPRGSLVVADAREWLDLLLFLLVAIVIGRLVASQHARADEAARRAAEANSLFALSRSLATAGSTDGAAGEIVARLCGDAELERAIILVGAAGRERVIADSGAPSPFAGAAIVTSLVRTPGDEPARWVRTHAAGPRPPATSGPAQYRVRIELDGGQLGTLIAVRDRSAGPPGREATRMLALAADQLAISLRRDQLQHTAMELEVARQGEALKTALIDSVSHDLRTPLASIRATAGGLADPAVTWTDVTRREAAARIDAEAARLDGLVRGLLDLGRVTSGAIHPDLEPHEPWAIVRPAVDRLRPALGERPVVVDVADDLPPILTDAALLDIVVTNLVDNAARHAPPPAAVAVKAAMAPEGGLALIVEDGGPGVSEAMLPHLFERLERAGRSTSDARQGLGFGLSVVKGLTEAMGGSVSAGRSALGGLAITVTLRLAPVPDEDA
jgi:two-component system, OmpR family, sensor histidine kinase KdpD